MSGQAVRRRLPGDQRVQILGPMEARLQAFDFAILGGLNEGVWPQRTRNDPWLNRPMKRDMGLEPRNAGSVQPHMTLRKAWAHGVSFFRVPHAPTALPPSHRAGCSA